MIYSTRKVISVLQCCDVCLIAVLLIATFSAEISATTVMAEYDFENYKVITPKKKIVLKCSVDGPQASVKWTKNGKPLTSGESGVTITNQPPVFQVTIDKPTDVHTGNYTCEASRNNTKLGAREIIVVSHPTASLDSDTIVVEEEKLTIDCHPTGKPTPNITWTIGDNLTLTSSSGRYELLKNKDDVPNGKLQISSAMMSDRGEYKCSVTNLVIPAVNGSEVVATTTVRVKDKLAALWPFLGICAEVFVLCAIILIYEKKRNKAELDESDTDNSPEQKNTPDHGKDSVRQRK